MTPNWRITVGDTRAKLSWTLRDRTGALATLTAVTVRMVNLADGSVKINAAAGTIGGTGIGEYQFVAADVNAAGLYTVQMKDTAGGSIQHWPVNGLAILEIVAAV